MSGLAWEGEMPRELLSVSGLTQDPVAIDVAWGRGTHVQMATLSHPELPSLSGSLEFTTTPDEPTRQGFYVDMSRESINRLIRVLRKARDQAFGVDE
jgi:hypothetical protein